VHIGFDNNLIHAHNHEKYHEGFIRSIFERLDPPLNFFEGDYTIESNINIHRSWLNSHYDYPESPNSNDPADGHSTGGTAHFDHDHINIAWKDFCDNDPFTENKKIQLYMKFNKHWT